MYAVRPLLLPLLCRFALLGVTFAVYAALFFDRPDFLSPEITYLPVLRLRRLFYYANFP